MAMLFLNPIGPQGESLATRAADQLGVAAGVDPEFGSVTLDDDSSSEEKLQANVFEALDGLDSDWRSQLELAD